MFTNRQILHKSDHSTGNISVLVVSPHPDDVACLRRILHHRDWDIGLSTGVADATKQLTARPPSVVICERDLPDGDWKDVFHHTEQMANAPLLLVVSKHADESLWAEVLNLGGYDVLLKPFDHAEVVRVVGMALRYWAANARQTVAPASLAPQFI